MDAIRQFSTKTFSSLRIRNFRLHFIGHAISQSGTWMQTVSLGWLVLELTDSGTHLGAIVACQFIPLLLLGPWGGLIADKHNKRKILLGTQWAFGLLVLVLYGLVEFDLVQVWMLYVFSLGLGIIRIFDNPARQTYVPELVGEENLKNAVSLNSTAGNLARVIGPTIGGFLIAWFGIASSFLFNAISYFVTVIMLTLMREEEMFLNPREEKGTSVRAQLREGFRYVAETPLIRNTLLMMAFIGTFAYEFQVSLPLLADRIFHGDAGSYAALLSAFGAGSVVGGLFAAGRHTVVPHRLADISVIFGLAMVGTSLMPTLAFAFVGMLIVGALSINIIALGNTMIQLESTPHMRGRVMALWSMAMIGSTAIGGPIIGIIGEYVGGRWGLATGGIIAILAALINSRTLYAQRLSFIIPNWLQRDVTPEEK